MNFPIRSVMHPTDFSGLSINAFVHALKISVTLKCKLYIVHISAQASGHRLRFPHVRQTLARWGLLDANISKSEVAAKLGVQVANVKLKPQDPVEGVSHFLDRHPSDLLVLATEGREGLPRWLRPSVAEAMFRRSGTPTLFLPAHSGGFVNSASGELKLQRILVPVDHTPPAAAAFGTIRQFCRMLSEDDATFHVVHVGTRAPALAIGSATPPRIAVELRSGNVIDGIVQAAADIKADLIAMATGGHDGVLDAIRGSTMERVLRRAPCAVLAIPALHER